MPTTRPRLPVTETDEVARALDLAARRWPGVPKTKLIRLILADWAGGNSSVAAQAESRRAITGSMPGVSGLYNRTEDWPA